jgi:hypothetical protein
MRLKLISNSPAYGGGRKYWRRRLLVWWQLSQTGQDFYAAYHSLWPSKDK